jgi:hypothetical protein
VSGDGGLNGAAKEIPDPAVTALNGQPCSQELQSNDADVVPQTTPSAPKLSARATQMQVSFRQHNARALARRAADLRASREEQLYANYLLYRLGNREAFQAFVDAFPLRAESFSRLTEFEEIVSRKCQALECADMQMALACAAMEGLPHAREKLLRLGAVTDAGAYLDNEFALAWVISVAPVEILKLAVCAGRQRNLIDAVVEADFPVGTRAQTMRALRTVRFADPAEQALQERIIGGLETSRENERLISPCEAISNQWR